MSGWYRAAGLSEYQARRPTVRNPPMSSTNGAAPRRWRSRRMEAACRTRPLYFQKMRKVQLSVPPVAPLQRLGGRIPGGRGGSGWQPVTASVAAVSPSGRNWAGFTTPGPTTSSWTPSSGPAPPRLPPSGWEPRQSDWGIITILLLGWKVRQLRRGLKSNRGRGVRLAGLPTPVAKTGGKPWQHGPFRARFQDTPGC